MAGLLRHGDIYDLAERQGGFFTARQAREAGLADNTHPYHVKAGNWIRERRGIYRLARFPLPSRPDLMLWQLWSHNRAGDPQGTFSHATALTLHELSDAMPRRLDMTVPPGFQRMAAIPAVLDLHRARLGDEDVETVEARSRNDTAEDAGRCHRRWHTRSKTSRCRRSTRRSAADGSRGGSSKAVKATRRTRQRIDRILKQVA